MMIVYKPVTLTTGATPAAAGMIALESMLGNGAAKYGYRDFKTPRCSSAQSSWQYIDRSSEFCSEIAGPSVEV